MDKLTHYEFTPFDVDVESRLVVVDDDDPDYTCEHVADVVCTTFGECEKHAVDG